MYSNQPGRINCICRLWYNWLQCWFLFILPQKYTQAHNYFISWELCFPSPPHRLSGGVGSLTWQSCNYHNTQGGVYSGWHHSSAHILRNEMKLTISRLEEHKVHGRWRWCLQFPDLYFWWVLLLNGSLGSDIFSNDSFEAAFCSP